MDNCKQHTGAFCLSCETATLRAQVARLERERDNLGKIGKELATELHESKHATIDERNRAEAAERQLADLRERVQNVDGSIDAGKILSRLQAAEAKCRRMLDLIGIIAAPLQIDGGNHLASVKHARAALAEDGGGDE